MQLIHIPYQTRKKVWEKATALRGHPPEIWRKDDLDHVMNWQEYNNPESLYGWCVKFIVPLEANGENTVSNMKAWSLRNESE